MLQSTGPLRPPVRFGTHPITRWKRHQNKKLFNLFLHRSFACHKQVMSNFYLNHVPFLPKRHGPFHYSSVSSSQSSAFQKNSTGYQQPKTSVSHSPKSGNFIPSATPQQKPNFGCTCWAQIRHLVGILTTFFHLTTLSDLKWKLNFKTARNHFDFLKK